MNNIPLDPESRAGLEVLEKVFGPLTFEGLSPQLNQLKEERSMSDQLSGVIEAKKVDGNRYGYRINGKWVSCFVGPETPEEVVKTLKDLDRGDEVTFAVYENKGFLNIDGIVNVVKGEPPQNPPGGRSGYSFRNRGQGGQKSGWKPEDKRPQLVTMTLAYAKDTISEILKSPDMANQAPEALLKFATEETVKLAKVYLDYCMKEAARLGWTPETKE